MELLEERRGSILQLTLNRPDRLNAVTEDMYAALVRALDAVGGDQAIRAVVIGGAGRAFCVGADLKGHAEGRRSEADLRRYVDLGQQAAKAILACRCPVIAAVNGHAIGAGLELALCCDLSVVASPAKLRFPEFGLGTFVGGGVTWTLARRVTTTKAHELLLLGRFFSGDEAVAMGLCNEAVAADQVPARAMALAEEIASKAPLSVSHGKRLLREAHGSTLDAALAAEADALLACMQTRDWQEGIDAFAGRRIPEFRGE